MANCGADSVCIIKYVGSPRLRDVFGRYMLGAGGLMGATGVPRGNLVWTDARVSKADPFIANALAHCVDDQTDVLNSI